MKNIDNLFFLMFLSICSCLNKQANDNNRTLEQDPKNYNLEIFVEGLAIPWGMCWLPDGSMLITEIDGELIHFKDGEKSKVANVPEIYRRSQGGLMDIEVHPNYKSNGWIYITYSSSEGSGEGGNTTLIRARLKRGKLIDIEKLYKGIENTDKGNHFGSRIHFDKKGFVYFSIGDRGNRNMNPQNIERDGGKVYRLNDDGTIPADNPFIENKNAKQAIFSYGHRNPQGMVLNPFTNEIWIHEHGPQGGDEINIIRSGKNYGWPKVTFGINYDGTSITDNTSLPDMEQPIHYWLPSIAPSGMEFITSDLYNNWKNHILIGSLKFQYLELLELSGNKIITRTKLLEDIGRVRNVRQGPDGHIYVAVENKGILKIIPE